MVPGANPAGIFSQDCVPADEIYEYQSSNEWNLSKNRKISIHLELVIDVSNRTLILTSKSVKAAISP